MLWRITNKDDGGIEPPRDSFADRFLSVIGTADDVPYWQALAKEAVPYNEQQAMALLKSIVPPSAFNRYAATGVLVALGQITGNFYLIRRGETTISLNAMGEALHSYCMHSGYDEHLPKTDDVVALWLMITGFESRFLDIANRSNHYSSGEAFVDEPKYYRGAVSRAKIVPDYADDLLRHADTPEEPCEPIQTITIPLDDIGIIEVDDAETELFPSLIPPETIYIDDEARDVWALERIQDRSERSERIAYDIDLLSARRRLWEFESTGVAPVPTLNAEGKLITEGIGILCLYLDPIFEPGYMGEHAFVDYESPEGRLRVPIMNWGSWRDVDDAVMGSLLDAYVQRLHTAVIRAETPEDAEPDCDEAMQQAPRSRTTKCIMSADVYEALTGLSPFYPPLRYQDLMVIIDDRVGDVVLEFANAEDLGAIPYITRSLDEDDRYGIVILEPINVIAYYFYNGGLHNIGYEQGVDMIYGMFPDNNSKVMDYQQHRFLGQSTCRLQDIADENPVMPVDFDNADEEEEEEECVIRL